MAKPYRKTWGAQPTDELRNDPEYIRSRATQGALLDAIGGPADLANYLSDYFYSGLNSLLDVGDLSPYNVPQSVGTANRHPIPGGSPQLEQGLVQSGMMRPSTGTTQETAMRMGLGLLDPAPVGAGSLTGPRGKNVFYSGLLDTAENASMGKGSAEQWMGYLKNQLGVKQSELEWTGVEDWLKSKNRPVTRQELGDYLQGEEIQVQEVVKGGDLPWSFNPDTMQYDLTLPDGQIEHYKTIDQLHRGLAEAKDFYETAKFGEYTLPGSENYRELLLTVPSDRYRGDFVSSHWGEPNIVAHVRFNDRTTPEGDRVLFLEEIQSDWAQEGRKKGFEDIYSGFEGEWKVVWEDGSEVDRTRRYSSEEEAQAVADGWTEDTGDKAIAKPAPPKDKVKPEPFVRNTEQWTSLALKRMMRYAADQGYDRIAWTPGNVQAARYDLSKQVDFISWSSDASSMTGEKSKYVTIGGVTGISGQNIEVIVDPDTGVIRTADLGAEQFRGKDLSDVVGRDIADKILSKEDGKLEEDGLKVGGEGMKAFYDKIVPNAANKIGKKHGAKTEVTTVETSEGPLKALSIPVTKKLKDAAQQGFPYYAIPLTVGGSGLLAEEQRRRRPASGLLSP